MMNLLRWDVPHLPLRGTVIRESISSQLKVQRRKKMAAYLVVNYRINNAEGIAKYREAVDPQLQKAGCELLVANDDVEVIEGSPAPTVVVLKFKSVEAAKNWYNSPEYQAVKHLRLNATTDGWIALSEGFQMPESG